MKVSKTVIALIAIGILFNLLGHIARAAEQECITDTQVQTEVCKDLPQGPRFWIRR